MGCNDQLCMYEFRNENIIRIAICLMASKCLTTSSNNPDCSSSESVNMFTEFFVVQKLSDCNPILKLVPETSFDSPENSIQLL